MSKNWWWHKSGAPAYQPKPCPICGKVIRRVGKHLNQKHPER